MVISLLSYILNKTLDLIFIGLNYFHKLRTAPFTYETQRIVSPLLNVINKKSCRFFLYSQNAITSNFSGLRKKVYNLKGKQTNLWTVNICYKSTNFPFKITSNIVTIKYVNCEKIGKNWTWQFFLSYNNHRSVLYVNSNIPLSFLVFKV